MKSFQTPKDGAEWMRQVNRRLSLIERHRHPAGGSGGSGEPGPAGPPGPEGPPGPPATKTWFACRGGVVGQALGADGLWIAIDYPTKVFDSDGIVTNGLVVAPRDGFMRLTATALLRIGSGSGNDFQATIGILNGAVNTELARGNQIELSSTGIPGKAVTYGLIVDTVVAVAKSDTLRPCIYASMPNRTKTIDPSPETHFYGEYVDMGASIPSTPNNLSWLYRRPGAADTYVPGSYVGLATLALPSTAPAGIYALDAVVALQAQVTTSGNWRIMWGATALSSDQRLDVQTLLTYGYWHGLVTHPGGAVNFTMAHQANGGNQNITVFNPNTSLRAIYLGPS